jgi:hypothetical protein
MPVESPGNVMANRLPRPRKPIAGLCALLAGLGVFAAAGCTSSAARPAAAASPSPQACKPLEAPVLPHAAGSLTEQDSGAFCLAPGQILDVFLTAPVNAAAGTRWSQIQDGDRTVLGYGNSGVLTPPVNVTPGVFVGAGHGATTLSSTLPDGKKWQVTVVVR